MYRYLEPTREIGLPLLAQGQYILAFSGQAMLFEVRIPAPLLPDGIIGTQSSNDLLLLTINGRNGIFGIRLRKGKLNLLLTLSLHKAFESKLHHYITTWKGKKESGR